MLFGAHVSIAGGIFKAPTNAAKIGCEVFQLFSRSPMGGPAPSLTKTIVADFTSAMKLNNQAEAYIHTPYYINLASVKSNIYQSSIKIIREELERASTLGVKYIMTHLGSAKDTPRKEAIKKVSQGIVKILAGYKGSALLLLENSAGSGNVVGDKFEELAVMIKSLSATDRKKIGVCLDTCHAFASGYDLKTSAMVNQTIGKFDKIIGLKYLRLIHCNDSKTEFSVHVDRHEHIGMGKIGLAGFKVLVNHPKLKKVNFILETPEDERGNQENDLKILKKLRG
ncbi:MAG: deoxyribonuclease IV [Patescibacteria group bacterium]|jgi:deoxyribonuclease-4